MAQSEFGKAVSRETAKAKAAAKKAGKKVSSKSAENSAGNKAKPKRGNPEKIKAHQFKPGQSGNPAGRPRNTVSDSIRHLLQTKTGGDKTTADAIAEKVISMALNGDLKAAEILLDRSEGKVAQPITGAGGGPVKLELSPTERMTRLAELMAKGRTKK